MNAVCERSAEFKELTCDNSVHVLKGLNRCSVPEFVGPFELMLNTERVRHMESDGTTVNYKSTLERVKNITLMKNNSLNSLNVSSTCNININNNNILGPC